MPHLVNPLLLADFLTDSYNIGGVTSLLALNSLFTLIQDYNFDSPDFYNKLYALLSDPSMYSAKQRERFFKLLNLFLSSTHLPAYMVAAFAKRLSRSALTADPGAILFILPMIYNLILRQKECLQQIHRKGAFTAAEKASKRRVELSSGTAVDASAKQLANEKKEMVLNDGHDPFVNDEIDSIKCNALQTSLWEVSAMKHLYIADVALKARMFEEKLRHQFLNHGITYKSLFEKQLKRKEKGKVPLAFEPFTTDCIQTMTSRVVNEIWREHIFQLAVTFHGGTRACSPDHYLHGNKKHPSEKSLDNIAQFQIGNTLAHFAGAFSDGEIYRTGTMKDVVYGVSGGMEDWGYAASWENQFYDDRSQPFRPCNRQRLEKTIYNNITNRAFSMLVETANSKEPKTAKLGDFKELYKANIAFFQSEGGTIKLIGHVPWNVRLALMMIEMCVGYPETRSFETRSNEDFPPAGLYTIDRDQQRVIPGTVELRKEPNLSCRLLWEVLGALTVDSTYVQVSSSASFEPDSILMVTPIKSGTTRRFYEFAPKSSQAMAASTDTMGTSVFVTCLEIVNITSDKIYLRALATVDQDWKKQGSGADAPFPSVAPQSHIVNSRTNADWDFEWNGQRGHN
ncbi:hypothetical protein PsorP6_001512 [Peronosclerospora sorghi]|uniref:Uncharacterized protein n=1 Tax=Peronosclerospora sorghi TaxID=230839 RepID=A0ACC0WTR7_9STRA|nr:hypothetical protein PsorP6_001512 [Peronosclerospora sorghi]